MASPQGAHEAASAAKAWGGAAVAAGANQAASWLQSVGINDWSDAAHFVSVLAGLAAFVYSVLLIVGWFMRRRRK